MAMEFEWDEVKLGSVCQCRGLSRFFLASRKPEAMRVTMKMRRVKVDPTNMPEGRIDERRVDETTEEDIARQQEGDDAEAMQEAAGFARRVRKTVGAHPS